MRRKFRQKYVLFMQTVLFTQMSLHNIIILKKKQWTQMKTKQLNWDYNNFPHRNARFTKPWTKDI